MQNINMLRIETKLTELFEGKIDLSDGIPDNHNLFCSRATAALAIKMECGVDDVLAGSCVTDGFHDLGVDAIYNDDVQKKLILVQSKWRANGTGAIDHEEILSFVQGVKRIINFEFEGGNEKIQKKAPDIISALKGMGYKIVCVYCHTGDQTISDFCYRPVKDLLETTNDDVSEILEFKEVTRLEIFKFLASGQDLDNISIDDVLLNNWGVIENPYTAYYGTISAAALGEWFSKYGNRLFDKNIRFYKGNTDVNQSMRKVLLDEPQNFFYYNNGVKLLCKKITRKAAHSTTTKIGLFSLEGVSLVNGAQTTGTIGSLYIENREQLMKANVYIQLIDLADADETYALQITKLSNSQNRIDSKEFAALDPQQERLRIDLSFSGIYYLYKSGSVVDDVSRQISLDETIVAQACLQPDITYTATAKRNVGALTEDIDKPLYKKLFNPATNAFSMKNSVEVVRAVEKYLSSVETEYQGRNRLALVHGNRFIAHLILQEIKTLPEYERQIIPSEDVREKVDRLCVDIVPKVVEAMNVVFPDAYPANIFKNVGRCKSILKFMKPVN